MANVVTSWWSRLRRQAAPAPPNAGPAAPAAAEPAGQTRHVDLEIALNDPLLIYLQGAHGPVELSRLQLDSPALTKLRAEGVVLVVPLVSQGELVGTINLGPRLSEQEYSSDDRRLLAELAAQAAPAVRVAQLVREQQLEIRERERIEQELRVARIIQQTLLPKELPERAGYRLAAYWQPARAVGGDFYDFVQFKDGRLGIFIGDVTDKGVPAALVMASTRSTLRAAAERLESPGAVLERANEVLVPEIPDKMFVTCLYLLLDPATGRLRYANAGHNLPMLSHAGQITELRATGMPLGLLPGMGYEEKEADLAQGGSVLVYSDGLTEAHNPQGEMFGFPRLRELLAQCGEGTGLIEYLRAQLAEFTGPGWEQEDDVTFVVLEREAATGSVSPPGSLRIEQALWSTLAEFSVPSAPDNERQAVEQVVEAVRGLGMPSARIERLKTAVAEATMNAMEHGNHYRPDLPVNVQVLQRAGVLQVRITDYGGEDSPAQELGTGILDVETPDLDAKLAGLQSARGWGLFLIRNMVDEMRVITEHKEHTVELEMKLEGDAHGRDL